MMHTLNFAQLKAATLCGGVTDVTLRGDGAAFVVSIQTRSGEAIMVTTRKQPRRFADPRKALQLLRGIGLHECRIDTTDWHPEAHALEKVPRPDRSAALKAAHEAAQADADYDRWFHAKVQAALDDPRPAIEPEDWPQIRAQRLAGLKQRLGL
ncbi:antitoxin PaaA2 family protein [Rhodoferax antarcticus]|uniref:antitoxin PaaA2 family protein n=1 Tax=Rhodoferax antarcticus TaxID=81479 RepID=UPI002225AAB0|nr:hypothetical protein [Rhodoferax antarcticus]MCW2310904.1 hypothetical protein [Rhodoferax antarcticus]